MSWRIDEDSVIIDGLNFDSAKSVAVSSKRDPFLSDWDTIKQYRGMNKAFKRRTTLAVKKSDDSAYMPIGSDARSKQINPGAIRNNGYGLFDVVTPPYNLLQLAQYYETHFANHAAVDSKVANMVGLGYHWELSPKAISRMESKETEEQRSSARKKVERTKIAMDQWIDSLNDEDTFIHIMEKVVTDLQALGNGYIEVGRKTNGEIGYIGHIPAASVRVRRLRDGFCQVVNEKVVFFANYGRKVEVHNPVTNDPNPNEIIHLKLYSPLNTFYGVPDVVSSGQAIIGDQFAQQYNIDYFENKAVPRYIVYIKGAKLSPDSEQRLFEFMQTKLKGNNHRTMVIPLPPDTDQNKVEFKMEPIEAGIQESSFNNYHESNRKDILSAHQVPLSKIGLGDGSLAGTIASDRTFKEQVARPGQRTLEKRINAIIKEATDLLTLKFNELTLTDEAAQAQIHEKYIRTQVLVPNEVRDNLGLPPRQGGDEPVELTARQAADTANEARGDDERSTSRENEAADSPNTVSGREPAGEEKKKQ